MEDKYIDFEQLSRIKVDGQDEKITNQDARKVYVAEGGQNYKRTSDFMLGNDNKNLDDGEYVNADDFLQALEKVIDK